MNSELAPPLHFDNVEANVTADKHTVCEFEHDPAVVDGPGYYPRATDEDVDTVWTMETPVETFVPHAVDGYYCMVVVVCAGVEKRVPNLVYIGEEEHNHPTIAVPFDS